MLILDPLVQQASLLPHRPLLVQVRAGAHARAARVREAGAAGAGDGLVVVEVEHGGAAGLLRLAGLEFFFFFLER